jgi:ATP-dependent DNA helicase RecQ
MSAEAVQVNQASYQKQKQLAELRLRSFIEYTLSEKDCRSQFIGTYFGDKELQPCGICDNCRSLANQQPLSSEEFSLIRQRIEQRLSAAPLSPKDLLLHIGLPKEKTWQVIEFMQAEKKLLITKSGLVRLG